VTAAAVLWPPTRVLVGWPQEQASGLPLHEWRTRALAG